MQSRLFLPGKFTMQCLLLVAVVITIAIEARAQDPRLQFIGPPPPMKFVPRTERAQLQSVRDAKAHTRAAIELAELRLVNAERMTAANQFDAASSELGIYQGLIEESLRYLGANRSGKNKFRDIYKRLELALRTHSARIESIRRVTPIDYKGNIAGIADFTCDARTEAINAFYDDNVVHETGCERVKIAPPETPQPAKEVSKSQ